MSPSGIEIKYIEITEDDELVIHVRVAWWRRVWFKVRHGGRR